MREIKFRAWDKWQKGWAYFTIGQIWNQDLKERYLAFCIDGNKFYEFTGLKDKNGKEINLKEAKKQIESEGEDG
jgi:hypothetical protein